MIGFRGRQSVPCASILANRAPTRNGERAMFNAKDLLDALMRGGAEPQGQQEQQGQQGQQGGLGALGDLLGQLVQGGQSPQTPRYQTQQDPAQQGSSGLEDLLRSVTGGQAGSMGDVQAKLRQQGGGLADILGQVLGQAMTG